VERHDGGLTIDLFSMRGIRVDPGVGRSVMTDQVALTGTLVIFQRRKEGIKNVGDS
jgi:hypothetical protein